MLNRLTDTLDFQAQALNLRSDRQRLIASNIANADTPGYVARDLDFAKALREATGSRQPARTLATDRPGHIAGTARRLPPATPTSSTRRRARPTSTATPSTWTASARASPTTRSSTRRRLRFINGHVRTMLSAITGNRANDARIDARAERRAAQAGPHPLGGPADVPSDEGLS